MLFDREKKQTSVQDYIWMGPVEFKALDLYQAYAENKIPQDQGIIFQASFDKNGMWIIFEYIVYSEITSLFLSDEGITFQASALKTVFLMESSDFPEKEIDPVYRIIHKNLPFRISDMDICGEESRSIIRYNKGPVRVYGLFSVEKSAGKDFSFVFTVNTESFFALHRLIKKTLEEECGVPSDTALSVAVKTITILKKTAVPV